MTTTSFDYDILVQAEREVCREDFFQFIQSFWKVVIPDKPVYNWHIEYLAKELQVIGERIKAREPKLYDLIINVPPGSTKSTIATVMFPAWLWAIDPTIKVISSSYSSGVSIDHAVKSRDVIKSDKYRELYPEVEIRPDKDGKSHYGNSKTGMRYVTSTGGTVTGMHGHVIIQDDPLNPKQSASEKEIENAKHFVDRTLSSRKVDKLITPVITIMQRLHEDDVTGHLLGKEGKKIKHICLPAEESERVNPPELKSRYINGLLDPVRLSAEVLADAKADLGSYAYAGQYDQNPAPEGGGLIKKAWFGRSDMSYLENATWDFVIDPAYTENENNDPSALMAYCWSDNLLTIRMVESVHMEFPDLCKYIQAFCKAHGYTSGSSIYVEPKASGKSIVQSLKQGTGLNIMEGDNPTRDKVARVKDITATLESGRVGLVLGAWNEAFKHQCAVFPNGKHDDEVDCLVMAVNQQNNVQWTI